MAGRSDVVLINEKVPLTCEKFRDGAWVAELTGLLNLTGWPAGMRVIARKERPHPGAQLQITDIDTNLPLHTFDGNRIWCAIVALAVDITAWMQMLAMAGPDACCCTCRTGRRGRTWCARPSPGYEPWPNPAEHHLTVPTTRTTTGSGPAPARDDPRATFTPRCHNQHPTAPALPSA